MKIRAVNTKSERIKTVQTKTNESQEFFVDYYELERIALAPTNWNAFVLQIMRIFFPLLRLSVARIRHLHTRNGDGPNVSVCTHCGAGKKWDKNQYRNQQKFIRFFAAIPYPESFHELREHAAASQAHLLIYAALRRVNVERTRKTCTKKNDFDKNFKLNCRGSWDDLLGVRVFLSLSANSFIRPKAEWRWIMLVY